MADLRDFMKKPVPTKRKEPQPELPPPVIKPMPMREGIEYKTNYFPELLESLRKTSSSNDKIALLKEFGSKSPYICEILQYAYDPFRKYYVTDKNLTSNPHGTQQAFDQDYLAFGKLLDRLNNREITGNEALNAVQSFIHPFTKEDGQDFIRILNRDIKAGISDTTINKGIPDCIPTFKVALANHYEDRKEYQRKELPFKETWYSRKLDGVRTLCIKKKKTDCYSRAGNEFKNIPQIQDALDQMPIDNVVFDGETVVINGKGQEHFRLTTSLMRSEKPDTIAKIQEKMNQVNGKPKLMIFDIIPLNEFQGLKGQQTYSEKYDLMKKYAWLTTPNTELVEQFKLTEDYIHPHANSESAIKIISKNFDKYSIHIPNLPSLLANISIDKTSPVLKEKLTSIFSNVITPSEANNLNIALDTSVTHILATKSAKTLFDAFDNAIEKNWEGLILRNGQSVYEGKRTNNMLKLKGFQDAEFSVVGAFTGEKDTQFSNALGGIIIDVKGNQVRVGTGFTEDERYDYWADFNQNKLGKIATIKFQREEINPDGSHTLILPSFKSFRDTFM